MSQAWPGVFQEALALIASADPALVTVVVRTVQISLGATLCAALLGLPLAGGLAAAPSGVRRFVLPVIQAAAALPAVLVGLVVLLALSAGREGAGLSLGSGLAVALGQLILALLVVTTLAEPVFRQVRGRLWPTALTLGLGPGRAWWMILHEGRAGLTAAVVAAFVRVVGEVGSAMLLGGAGATVAVAIVNQAERQAWSAVVALGLILSALAVVASAVFVRLRDNAC
jgi:tungstate transport system permease protein